MSTTPNIKRWPKQLINRRDKNHLWKRLDMATDRDKAFYYCSICKGTVPPLRVIDCKKKNIYKMGFRTLNKTELILFGSLNGT